MIADRVRPRKAAPSHSAPHKKQSRSGTVANGRRPGLLARTTFRTSREMDFFSQKELVTQTGHPVSEWPFVVVKELLDNGLDACEDADIPPVVEVIADEGGIAVRDNGPGLPDATLASALDFTIRTSNREAYVSPCRGAQGNGFKTLIPMPCVLDPEHGKLVIQALGKRHTITCTADPVSQRPVIHDDTQNVKTDDQGKGKKASFIAGTEVRLQWQPRRDEGGWYWPFDTALYPDAIAERVRNLVAGFALFNPHARITLRWFGKATTWEPTNTTWPKWKPNRPTSPHWYEQSHFERLIGAYVTHDREAGTDRLVSDLLAEFDGLSGSAKRTKVLKSANAKRMKLSELVLDGAFDTRRIGRLLAAMKAQTRPVQSKYIGVLGEDHLRQRLVSMGVKEESFRYGRKLENVKTRTGESDKKASFLPWVLEAAFGWLGDDSPEQRRIFTGVNWSAAIGNPFRSFGTTGEGLETMLAEMRATRHEPVVFVLHLAHPRVEYTDRGKSALVIGGVA